MVGFKFACPNVFPLFEIKNPKNGALLPPIIGGGKRGRSPGKKNSREGGFISKNPENRGKKGKLEKFSKGGSVAGIFEPPHGLMGLGKN